MKSFYILPYIIVHANVLFGTEKEADEFVEKAKSDSRYLSAHKQATSYAGNYYVSVNFEEYAKDKYLITLANEDIEEDVNEYFKNAWPNLTFPDNWEIYEDSPMIKCIVECCECGKEFEMDLYNGDFGGILYRNFIKNQVDELNFICEDCYDYLNDHIVEPDWTDFI